MKDCLGQILDVNLMHGTGRDEKGNDVLWFSITEYSVLGNNSVSNPLARRCLVVLKSFIE